MATVAELRQSTATTLLLGPFLDDTDGKTAETALTLSQADIRLWKEGGTTLAQKSEATSATHRELGLYTCPIDTTDTNTLGTLSVAVIETGALAVRQDYKVITADEWDRKYKVTGPVNSQGILDRGTAASVSSTTVFALAAAAAFADDTLIGCIAGVYGSTQGYWQFRTISDNALTGDSVTVDPGFAVQPSGTVTYVIYGSTPSGTTNLPAVNATQVGGQTASAAGTVTFPGTIASTTNITAGTITTVTNLTNAPSSGDLTATMKASVNAEVLDVLATDTTTPPTAAPAANASMKSILAWLLMKNRNKITQTATTQLVLADDGVTTVATSTVSDNGTTATRGEFV